MPEPEQPAETQPVATSETEFQDEAAGLDDMAAAMAAQAAETGGDNPDPVTIDGAPPLAPPPRTPTFCTRRRPVPDDRGRSCGLRAPQGQQARQAQIALESLPKFRWPLAPLPTLLLGLGAIVVILVGWRADVVRLLPQTASFYSTIGLGVNLRGLEFENIKTSREIHEGVPVMVVEGEIVSVSRKAVDVPRLRFGVRNGLGAEIYNWTAMPSRTIAQDRAIVCHSARGSLRRPPRRTTSA